MRTGERFTREQLRDFVALGLPKDEKKLKYSNIPTFVKNQRFDSKKEAKRYIDLVHLERAGQISELEIQPEFEFKINGETFLTSSGRVFKYRADFRYVEDGKTVIEDVKSPVTEANPVYRIKRDLMKHVHGIEIFET